MNLRKISYPIKRSELNLNNKYTIKLPNQLKPDTNWDFDYTPNNIYDFQRRTTAFTIAFLNQNPEFIVYEIVPDFEFIDTQNEDDNSLTVTPVDISGDYLYFRSNETGIEVYTGGGYHNYTFEEFDSFLDELKRFSRLAKEKNE